MLYIIYIKYQHWRVFEKYESFKILWAEQFWGNIWSYNVKSSFFLKIPLIIAVQMVMSGPGKVWFDYKIRPPLLWGTFIKYFNTLTHNEALQWSL